MKRSTKMLLLITVIVLIIATVTVLLTQERNRSGKEVVVPTQKKVVVPTRIAEDYSSQTGAKYISPADGEYTEIQLIANLRNRCPLTYEAFDIDYDYNKNKFGVVIKEGLESNNKLFEKWMRETGYDQISPSYFEIK